MADNYTINEHGIIQDPGKFEAEPAYAPYFWDQVLEGGSDETLDDNGVSIDVCLVTADDRAKFPALLHDVYAVLIWETDQGFVETREVDEQELTQMRTQLEDDEPSEPGEDDLTTSDHETFYQNGRMVLDGRNRQPGIYHAWIAPGKPQERMGPFADYRAALRAYMDRVQFWPNVWFISDHGNAHLIDLNDGK